MKKVLALVALMVLFAGSAFAYSFPMYRGTPQLPGTQFEDDNLEYFVDNNGSDALDVGDYLYSAIEFTKVLDLVGGASAYDLNQGADQLVGIARIQLLNIQTDPILGQTWFFGQIDANTPMVQVYSGGTTNLDLFTFNSDPSWAQALAAVTDGTHLWDFSVTADLDTFWTFQPLNAAAPNPSAVAALASTTKVGVVNYQLNQVWGEDVFEDVLGDVVIADGLVDLIGSGDVLGGEGLVNGAFGRSDIDAAVNYVPEPTTMVLLGLGVFGLVATYSRKRGK